MSTLDIFCLEEGRSLSCIFMLDHFFLIILFYLQVEFYKFRKHLFPKGLAVRLWVDLHES